MFFRFALGPNDQDFFCIEGTHLIEELLKSGKNPSKILVTEKWLRKNQDLSKKFHQSLTEERLKIKVLQFFFIN